MHINAAEQRRTINCHVVECVDGGREVVEKCKNVQENVKQVLVFIRSWERASEPALHVSSGPTTVWRVLVTACMPHSLPGWGGLAHWCAVPSKIESPVAFETSVFSIYLSIWYKNAHFSVCHDRKKVCCGLLSSRYASRALRVYPGSL